MTDLINLEANERVDLIDLSYALNAVPSALQQEVTGNVLLKPGASSIVSGFRPSGSGQGPVTVGDANVPNIGFVGQRDGTTITSSVLSCQGAQQQSLAIGNLAAGTYLILIRFNRVVSSQENRAYWSPADAGKEYAQLTTTRLAGVWEMILEPAAPSGEWVQVGRAVITSAGSGQGSTVTVIDDRRLYFEGLVNSGMSVPWGTGVNDRSTDRVTYGIRDLQTALDAIRTCIVDIKGRGLQPWYSPNIGGMNIGSRFAANVNPSDETLNVGDANFGLRNAATGTPRLVFSGDTCTLQYVRGNDTFYLTAAGRNVFNANKNGLIQTGTNASYFDSSVGLLHTSNAQRTAVFARQVTGSADVAIQSQPGNGGGASLSFGTFSQYDNNTAFYQIQTVFNGTETSYALAGRAGQMYKISLNSLTAGDYAWTLYANQYTLNCTTLQVNSVNSVIAGSQAVYMATPALFLQTKRIQAGATVWAAGYFSSVSAGTVVSPNGGTTLLFSSSEDSGYSTNVITFSRPLPPQALIFITLPDQSPGVGNLRGYSATASFSGSKVTVIVQNGTNSPVRSEFYYQILYGADPA